MDNGTQIEWAMIAKLAPAGLVEAPGEHDGASSTPIT